jgi:uncharacterized damage-inducible protein DinB
MSTFTKLVDHLEWADRLALGALRAAVVPNAKAREIYAHVLGAEHTWLSRIAGRAPVMAVWPSLDDAACERVGRDNVAGLRHVVDSATEADLARVVSYRNSAGLAYESTVADILLQVVTHGAYHRGQIALLLRQGGAEPAPTDFIAFIRGAPAATRSYSAPS